MVLSIASFRFEKVEWPSNREDICYLNRGQLGLINSEAHNGGCKQVPAREGGEPVAIHEEHTVVIERPVEEVFAFAADPNNDTLWQSTSLETEQTSEGPVDVGTTFRNTSKFLGRRIESTYEVTENDPPHKQCVRITSGPIPGSGCYLFEPAGGGDSTRFTQRFEAEVGGFFRLAEPLVGRAIRRQQEADMATLKDMLEAGETKGT